MSASNSSVVWDSNSKLQHSSQRIVYRMYDLRLKSSRKEKGRDQGLKEGSITVRLDSCA